MHVHGYWRRDYNTQPLIYLPRDGGNYSCIMFMCLLFNVLL